MNTRFLRFVFVLALALSALGIPTSAVLADQPFTYEFDYGGDATITDICSFPLTSHSEFHARWTDFYAQGVLTKSMVHVYEVDTFSANGKTLVGLPYTYAVQFFYDTSGKIIRNDGVGVVEKVPLPDGNLFVAAGRIDWLNHSGPVFAPDKGTPGNVAAFCAALQ